MAAPSFESDFPMKLREIVAQLEALPIDSELTICARRPWTANSEAVVTKLTDELKVPPEVTARGFDYLLEVDETLSVFGVFSGPAPTLEEKIRLLIHYGEHDAFPDWVYARNEA